LGATKKRRSPKGGLAEKQVVLVELGGKKVCSREKRGPQEKGEPNSWPKNHRFTKEQKITSKKRLATAKKESIYGPEAGKWRRTWGREKS